LKALVINNKQSNKAALSLVQPPSNNYTANYVP